MKNLTLYAIKPRFVKALDGVTDGLAKAGVSPDAVTLLALPVASLIAAALLVGTIWPVLWLLVPVGSVLLMAANAIDGSLARRTAATRRGAVLNELVDRLGDVLILGSLCLIVPAGPGSAALVSVLLAETIALIGWGALGTRALVGIMGKPDRAFLISCAAVFGFFFGLQAFTPAAVVIDLETDLPDGPTTGQAASRNAYLNSFLTHARNLAEFLNYRQECQRRPDDLHADDFVRGFHRRVKEVEDRRGEINKLLAHLSTGRREHAPKYEWPYVSMRDAVLEAMKDFADALPDELQEAWCHELVQKVETRQETLIPMREAVTTSSYASTTWRPDSPS